MRSRDQSRPTARRCRCRAIRDYTDRAVECLRKAKARGFADVVGLETDPDLEPIRDEPGFRALIAEFPRPAVQKP